MDGKILYMSIRDRVYESRLMQKLIQSEIKRELFEGLSIMRNIVCAEGKVPSDMVLVRLAARGGRLEHTYLKMLAHLRVNDQAAAKKEFLLAAHTELAEEYADILISWDYTNLESQKEIIMTFQHSLRQMNKTALRKRDEFVSDLIYVPAVANVMLIFINFIYVGYFMEQKGLLSTIFTLY